MAVALAALTFLALGLATGRFTAVLVAPAVWTVFFVGLDAGWWGSGLGDGWIAAFVLLTTAGMIATALGALIRRGFTRIRAI